MRGQKNHPNRGHKPPNSPDGRNTSSNPPYLGPYPVTNPPERNPEPGSPNIPNNPGGRNTLSNPQYLGPYLVTSPEVTSPEPQLERPKVLDPRELQPSAYPKIFRTPNPSPTAVRLAVYLLRRVYQGRPARSRRYSTGELPVRDKLANTFVMGIPRHRFGIGKGKNSIASAPCVMAAEYCGDPYRMAIKERLAAGKPRAPPRSEFAMNSRIYHAAGEDVEDILELQKGEEPGVMKQVMSLITGMAYAMYVFADPKGLHLKIC
ncbi:hypothetical protein NCS56_00388900 [Fusarium sp. Ph1]|nr:hypothetical protein NCS56_00388900 [Fusarium sp. Ph1]